MDDPAAIRQAIIVGGRKLLARGLAWGCSGNISLRTDEDAFIISASGASLGALTANDLTECRVSSSACLGPTPSRETDLHRAIYRSRSDVGAVVHASPFYTTLIACCHVALRTDLFPEAMVYLGKLGWVPYHHPGSRELAEAVANQAEQRMVLILENHGVVALGHDLDQVVLRLETLEFLCRLEVTARAGGLPVRYLGDEVARAFVAQYQAPHSNTPEGKSC